jgi:hypothetical protein
MVCSISSLAKYFLTEGTHVKEEDSEALSFLMSKFSPVGPKTPGQTAVQVK